MSLIGTIPYIKISRTDGNGIDITNSLEALSNIVLPLSTGNKVFNILNRTKQAEYFLFYVSTTGTENIPAIDKSSPNYSFSGSYSGFFTVSNFRGTPPITASVDNQNFFLEGGGSTGLGAGSDTIDSYRIMTLPAKNICATVSSSVNFKTGAARGGATTSVTASVRILTSPLTPGLVPSSPTIVAESVITQSAQNLSTTPLEFTGSYELSTFITASGYTPGDCLYFDLHITVPGDVADFEHANFTNGIFEISSSNAVVNPKDMSVEPYFTSLFYGTDCDVMYGDINRAVLNPFLQDIDYSEGIIVPTNYIALRDNTATKATVPESVFTVNSLINPGYGSKNQSEKINEWTKSSDNIGTFGKTSPVDSLKSLVVYSDWIGGNSPEKHDSCAAHVKYIINEDGTITEPNLSDTSIGNVQQAFESNQNLILNLTDPPIAQGMEVLNGIQSIDKGGYRIEPILYTQSGSLYTGDGNVHFTGSALMGGTEAASAINNFYFLAYISSNISYSAGSTTKVDLDEEISDVNSVYDPSNNRFTISQTMIDDGVDITLIFNARIVATSGSPLVFLFVIKNGDTSSPLTSTALSPTYNPLGIDTSGGVGSPYNLNYTIPASSLLVGDYYEIFIFENGFGNFRLLRGNNTDGFGFTSLSSTQQPAPLGTSSISVGTNTIWGYPSTSDFSIITGSQDALNSSYGFYKQVDIPNSGFKTISEDWSLKPGDEFRFEDREDRVFMVQSVIPPSSHPSGTLEVQLDKQIPTASINLDHFVIRRYVPDGSFILFNEDKPSGNTGPSLIKPQFVTQTLTKGVDEYIVDLTSKGLIPQ